MDFLSNLFNGIGGLFGGGGSKGASGGGNPLMSLFGNPMAQGLGLMGAGQLLGGNVKAPNLNTPQMQNYQNFTANPPQLPQSMQDQINNSLAIQEDYQNRQLRDTYKNLRPGTDYTTDSNYQRDLANLQRSQSANRSNAMMGPTLQYLQPEQQALANQAEMSTWSPMLQYGQATQRAQNTKNMFGNLGGMSIMSQFFPNMFGGQNTQQNPGSKNSNSNYDSILNAFNPMNYARSLMSGNI